MKVIKLSPGIEEIHYPSYFKLEYNKEIEVPNSIGMTLINRWDFKEVKEIKIKTKKSRRK